MIFGEIGKGGTVARKGCWRLRATAGLLLAVGLSLNLALLPATALAGEALLSDDEPTSDALGPALQEELALIDAMFFVAYPEDPSKLPETEADLGDVRYSGAIYVEAAIDPAVEWVESPSEGTKAFGFDGKDVGGHLACVPGEDQIVAAVASSGGAFDPETQTVVWYVIKSLSDGWHVDGILVDKAAIDPNPGPVDPIDPVDPVDPIDPVDPVDPVGPIDPVEPVDPVDPVNPPDAEEPEPEAPSPEPPAPRDPQPQPSQLQPPASPTRQGAPEPAALPSVGPAVTEEVVSKAQEAAAYAAPAPLGSIPDTGLVPELGSLAAIPSPAAPLSKEAAVAMQAAAACGVVVLGGAAVGLGGASALSFMRVRRSAKALEALFGRVK